MARLAARTASHWDGALSGHVSSLTAAAAFHGAGLGAVPAHVALLVAVAADKSLRAIAGHMAILATVVASAWEDDGLRTVMLGVTGDMC